MKTDWEVELAIIIGTRAKNVAAHDAMRHVAGYAVGNDVSEREWQSERGGTWDKGKGCRHLRPARPLAGDARRGGRPAEPVHVAEVDGQRMQDGSTRTMIFDVQQFVAYVSHFITLHPGDVITTGTPPGVGLGMKPPVFLRAGQEMRLGIEGLGEQRQRLVDWAEEG